MVDENANECVTKLLDEITPPNSDETAKPTPVHSSASSSCGDIEPMDATNGADANVNGGGAVKSPSCLVINEVRFMLLVSCVYVFITRLLT